MILSILISEVYMRINKEDLARLSALPDDQLWAEVQKVGKAHGFNLPQKQPSHQDMERLRGIVNGSRINMSEAIRILNEYRRAGGR